jgi:hypothetical protein
MFHVRRNGVCVGRGHLRRQILYQPDGLRVEEAAEVFPVSKNIAPGSVNSLLKIMDEFLIRYSADWFSQDQLFYAPPDTSRSISYAKFLDEVELRA